MNDEIVRAFEELNSKWYVMDKELDTTYNLQYASSRTRIAYYIFRDGWIAKEQSIEELQIS